MRVCHETIYQALLVRDDTGLHKRYAKKLRTGRRIRKTRWRTRTGQGSRIRNMVMIDQRPAEAETKQVAGHWEGRPHRRSRISVRDGHPQRAEDPVRHGDQPPDRSHRGIRESPPSAPRSPACRPI